MAARRIRRQLAKEKLALRVDEIVEEEGAIFASPTRALTTGKPLADEEGDGVPGLQSSAPRRNPAPT